MRPAASEPWTPQLGASPADGGFRFRVWAPERHRVELIVDPYSGTRQTHGLDRSGDGFFIGHVNAAAGARYSYLLDGDGPFPDPASRFQPDGVHGPSALIDPRAFHWSDADWHGRPLEDLIIYEAHVGTFSPEGTYAGLTDRLEHLSALGVTAIELMPVADFAGQRNWGYDGVDLFAPARAYGSPDDLRRLVDAAHRHGIAILLDVVYNHIGPDGAYLSRFSPYYFSDTHHTPWGRAVNLDGPHAAAVRTFFLENALHWIHEYHIDGLRLDATHALVDDSPRHFLRELGERVRASLDTRTVVLIAEDNRNLARYVTHTSDDGLGLDATWSDDFHHQVRRAATDDSDPYFQAFSGSTIDLAATIRRGWFYTGQRSSALNQGAETETDVPPHRVVVCLQNHDQVGNRATGERLNRQVDPAVFRALTALLLFVPETPLLFMGQEWAASTPFLYFTDHEPELGALVADGRREELSRKFLAFADRDTSARIPDPQAETTFLASRLDWTERAREPHAGVERLHRQLIALRRNDPAFRAGSSARSCEVAALGEDTIGLLRRSPSGSELLLIVRLRGSGAVDAGTWDAIATGSDWRMDMHTEAPEFAEAPQPATIERHVPRLVVHFPGPAGVILRRV